MNTCICCFKDYLVKCSDTINVFAKLAAATQYKWVVTDKFDSQFEGDFTTDADGFWAIPVADLPAGILTEFSGEFKLQVYSADNNCAPVMFQIAQVTDCITFSVRGGTRVKDNLGCEF